MSVVTMSSPVDELEQRISQLEDMEAEAAGDGDEELVSIYSKQVLLLRRVALWIDALETQRADVLKVLQELELHHVQQNRAKGRDERRSHTLRLVRAGIDKLG